jgi:hypothetical protein
MKKIAVGVAILAQVAACGEEEAPPPSTLAMADMDMGSAFRADMVDGAERVSGRFELLETAPYGYDAASGRVWLARHDAGTTVTVELVGLPPSSSHIPHVHAGGCRRRAVPTSSSIGTVGICRQTRSISCSTATPMASGS